MEYVVRALSFLLIPFVVSGVLAFLHRSQKSEEGKVRLPKAFALIGGIGTALCAVPILITAFSDPEEQGVVAVIWFFLALLPASLVVGYFNCRIEYDEDGFTAKNFFGIKRRFTYDEVTGAAEELHQTYLYLGTRHVMVDGLAVGGDEFLYFVAEKYWTLRDSKKRLNYVLPKVRRRDVFKGHIDGAAGFLFVYALGFAVFLMIALLCTYMLCTFQRHTAENTTARWETLHSCREEGEELVLTSVSDRVYRVKGIRGEDAAAIAAVCDGKTALGVYFFREDGQKYDTAVAIARGDGFLLDFGAANNRARAEMFPVLYFLYGMLVLWCVYVGFAIVVGRNPRKYKRIITKFFFREDHVKF